jgi:hypothetical protein
MMNALSYSDKNLLFLTYWKDILCDDVDIVFGENRLIILDNVGVVDNPHDLALITDLLLCMLCQFFNIDRLQSIVFQTLFVYATVNY